MKHACFTPKHRLPFRWRILYQVIEVVEWCTLCHIAVPINDQFLYFSLLDSCPCSRAVLSCNFFIFLFSHVIFPLFAGPKGGNFYGWLFKSVEQSLLGSKLLFDVCSLKPVVCGIIFFSDTSSLFIGSVISCGICIIWYFSEMQLIHVILLPSCSSPS